MSAPSLLADIGGTNTRVALSRNGEVVQGSVRHYPNREFTALEPVLRLYLSETGTETPAAACLAMAGPVREGVGRMTNLDWTLDTATLAHATGAESVTLLNDLQAQGHAVGHLPSDALYPVIAGPPPRLEAAQLVIGIGTGFNAAPIFNTLGGRFVPPSESGHAGLPVRSEEDLRLARFLEKVHGFASIEDALSGRGLVALHQFVCEEAGASEQASLSGRQIMQAVADDDTLACGAIALFSRLLGAVAGDLALTQLPFGGIFLIGGVARAMGPYLAEAGFVDGLRGKGRFSDFMRQFSVTVISDDDAALIGMARHLKALLARS
ncbi:glucokinase [Tropicimonas isoalkanivorans]|uniref:Glucokinase n=1 Tax=Tropicimonas isoalkanivorans TaxID=441112 RepID=A0A1I1KD85_9RHOB|nr:glucokinase [Tropicimonas isoalkanivorans]SFC58787.1 glucokinase [Tropicimonas isoalkanivorans]